MKQPDDKGMAMAGDLVTLDIVDGVHILGLNRPDKLNALTAEMFRQLDRHLREGVADAACVLLTGRGRSFCAGHDLDDLATHETYEVERFATGVIERLATLPMPVVAAVRGHCYTGGLELVLSADVIFASDTARFADTHSKWDLVPIWGMTQRLPRRIGPARAAEMMFSGRNVNGQEAAAIGLANACLPDEALDAHAMGFCTAVLANSARSHRAIKTLLCDTEGMPLAQGLAWELHHSQGHGPQFLARLQSHKAKTLPHL